MKALDSVIAFVEEHPLLVASAGWGIALYLFGFIAGRMLL